MRLIGGIVNGTVFAGVDPEPVGPARLIAGILNARVFGDVDPDPEPVGPARLIAGILKGAGVGAAARTKSAKIGASAARLRQGELYTLGREADVASCDGEGARDNAAGYGYGGLPPPIPDDGLPPPPVAAGASLKEMLPLYEETKLAG